MAIVLRLFLFATGLVILALAVTTSGLLPPPEVRTRVGEIPAVSRSLLQQAMAPPTLFDRLSLEPAAAPADEPSEMRAPSDPAAAATPADDRPAHVSGAAPAESIAPTDAPTLAFATERSGEEPPPVAPAAKAHEATATTGAPEASELDAASAIASQSESNKSAKTASAKRKVGSKSGKSHRRAGKSAKRKMMAKPAAEERKAAETPASTTGTTEESDTPRPEVPQTLSSTNPSTSQTAVENSATATANGPQPERGHQDHPSP